MEFLLEAFNTADYLEKVSGLADMLENTNFDDVRLFRAERNCLKFDICLRQRLLIRLKILFSYVWLIF